jgi:hypothetical protein
METVVKNVRDLDLSDRSALERVIGHQLRETQQVIVNVVNLDLAAKTETANGAGVGVPPWGNIYDGLKDEDIDRLDTAIRQRADLTRVFE